jgi:hypothetical protein
MKKEKQIKKQQSGLFLIKKLINIDKEIIRDKRSNIKWYKSIYKSIKRLVKSNPKEIYIFDYADLTGCKCHYIDVILGIPVWYGKLKQRWITTLCTKKLLEEDQKQVMEYGGIYPLFDDKYPENKFDDMYFDIPYFNNEQTICVCFREWLKIFIPELKNTKIVYRKI